MLTAGLRICHQSLIFISPWFALVTQTAKSSVRLDSWQSYGGMAEQGAICAAFSRLMQLQTLVDPRLGKLWQERQRHARSVISTAADLEGIGELTSLEINHLVDRYAAWLMINLTETEHISLTDGNAHEAATKMIGDVCTQIYQRADQSIIKAHPELASCAVAGNCIEPALTTTHEATTHEANTALSEQPDHMQRLMHQNLILQQRIDNLEAADATATALPLTSHPSDQHSLPPTTESIDFVSPLAKPTENSIGMTGLDFAFSIPAQPGTTGYVVHIGTYRSETEAYRAQHQLEQSDPHHFRHIAFSVTPLHRRNATLYSLVSAPLAAHHVADLCAALWQQKMGCSASYTQ